MQTPTITVSDQVAEVPMLCISIERLPAVADIPRTAAYELAKSGRIRTFRLGKRRLVMLDTLREDMRRIAAENAA